MFYILRIMVNPESANITKWSNALKQFVGELPTNCLSVFDHFVRLALKGLTSQIIESVDISESVDINQSI